MCPAGTTTLHLSRELEFSRIGFDALPLLTIFKQGQIAVALFLGGVVMMATATSTAWRETGGY